MGLMKESILSVMLSRMTALLSLSNVRAAAAVLQCCRWLVSPLQCPWARLGPVPVVSTAETAQLTRPCPAHWPHSQGMAGERRGTVMLQYSYSRIKYIQIRIQDTYSTQRGPPPVRAELRPLLLERPLLLLLQPRLASPQECPPPAPWAAAPRSWPPAP